MVTERLLSHARRTFREDTTFPLPAMVTAEQLTNMQQQLADALSAITQLTGETDQLEKLDQH